MADFRIDIICDTVCPWAYLGYSRLKQAMEQLGDDYRFDIRWQPLELHPEVSTQGQNRTEYLTARFGSEERLNEADHAMQQVGKEEGIEFNFSDKAVVPNTHLSHQLIYIANTQKLGTSMALALFYAYFTEAKNLGDVDVLADIAKQAGLSSESIDNAFTEETKLKVEKKLAQFKKLEIDSSPTYVINDQYVIQGPHQAKDFFKVIMDIAEKTPA
jgi:predicted DsbA family dithiol-disulfide isomerase